MCEYVCLCVCVRLCVLEKSDCFVLFVNFSAGEKKGGPRVERGTGSEFILLE